MAVLDFLTSLSIVLLIGIVITAISRRFRIPNVLGLIIIGIALAPITIQGLPLFAFSNQFLTAVAIIALIMIVFDSTSRLPVRSISHDTAKAFYITFAFMFLELTVFSIAAHYLANMKWFHAILLASILVGTDPSAVLAILKGLRHHVITMLEVEAVVNTPLTVIIPFIVIEIAQTFELSTIFYQFIDQISPFLQQIITGIGAGMVVALIVFRVMRKQYSEVLSPVTLIASALLTYILAEGLGGNGVLAVTTLGVFFGTVYIKRKETLRTFGSLLSNLFEILVFLLLGLSISLPLAYQFYVTGLILFVIYLALRTIVVFFLYRKSRLDGKEKFFMSLNSSKGVAVGVVAFTILSLEIQTGQVIEFSLLFILYSVILSTILARFSKYFLGVLPEEK